VDRNSRISVGHDMCESLFAINAVDADSGNGPGDSDGAVEDSMVVPCAWAMVHGASDSRCSRHWLELAPNNFSRAKTQVCGLHRDASMHRTATASTNAPVVVDTGPCEINAITNEARGWAVLPLYTVLIAARGCIFYTSGVDNNTVLIGRRTLPLCSAYIEPGEKARSG
jgi:hypothetical protein